MVNNTTTIAIIMTIISVAIIVLIVCVLKRNRKKTNRRQPFNGIPKTDKKKNYWMFKKVEIPPVIVQIV